MPRKKYTRSFEKVCVMFLESRLYVSRKYQTLYFGEKNYGHISQTQVTGAPILLFHETIIPTQVTVLMVGQPLNDDQDNLERSRVRHIILRRMINP